MQILTAAGAFLLTLMPLVVFHELGHYIAARLCGVHVERFSVGFGATLWRYQRFRGATEWVLAAVPLGGYVRLRDSRNDEVPRTGLGATDGDLAHKSPWQRLAIAAAGPLANLVLAVLLIFGLLTVGSVEPTTKLRAPDYGSAAASAGLRYGDAIVAVESRPVRTWDELRRALVPPLASAGAVRLTVRGAGDAGERELVLKAATLGRGNQLRNLGLAPWRDLARVTSVAPDSPAERAGIAPGDVIWAVDGKRTMDGLEVVEHTRTSAYDLLHLTIARGAEMRDLMVTLNRASDGTTTVGVGMRSDPEMTSVRYNPFAAVIIAVDRTWDTLATMAVTIGQLLLGALPLSALAGPLGIAQEAGRFFAGGVVQYIQFAAAMSVNLCLMNLLPISTLDGGAVIGALLEGVRGKPLSPRALLAARLCGIFLLAMLFGIGTYNDVGRLG